MVWPKSFYEDLWIVSYLIGYRNVVSDSKSFLIFFCVWLSWKVTQLPNVTFIRAVDIYICWWPSYTQKYIVSINRKQTGKRFLLTYSTLLRLWKLFHMGSKDLCLSWVSRDMALPWIWMCELCGVPLSSILWHVALFSTLVYLPLLLLAQLNLHNILPEIWKSYNDSLTLRQKHLLLSFSACGSLLCSFSLYICIFHRHLTASEIVSISRLLFLYMDNWLFVK